VGLTNLGRPKMKPEQIDRAEQTSDVKIIDNRIVTLQRILDVAERVIRDQTPSAQANLSGRFQVS